MRIPKIIHQTWKTNDVPPNLAQDFLSWKKHHPTYQFIGWDDASLLAFVETEFPQHLDLFKSYAQQIERVNMARYLILKRIGGIFVDLDLECLRPIEPLLDEWTILAGCEPDSHAEHPAATRYKLTKIVGTAFLASVPEHPFWDHAIAQLPYFRHLHDPLETTGPIFLTNAIVRWDNKSEVALAPAPLIYPFDRAQTWSGATFDIEFWEQNTREAFAVHHWEGTWLERGSKNTRSVAQLKGGLLTETFTVAAPNPTPNGDIQPLISCLMVTRDRVHLAANAIQCFQNQTYPYRELVILDDSPENELADLVEKLADPKIRHIHLPDEKLSLGALRNLAVDHARGHYVAQWDDDDLYDPLRLECQYTLIRQGNAHACMVSRWTQWWPEMQRLSLSFRKTWEGSLLCEKSVLPRYPELRIEEDAPVIRWLVANTRIVLLDMPRLYIYITHGDNTWPAWHFENFWNGASARFESEAHNRVFTEINRRVPAAVYAKARISQDTTSTTA